MALPVFDVATLTDAEVTQLKDIASREEQRRLRVARAPEQADVIAATYLDDVGRGDGTDWVQPTGAHDAYPTGRTVTHNGRTWESLTPANVWEPGVSGWREVTEGNDWPDWVQPTGEHDAYPLGAQVTHDGQHWINTGSAANVWAPGVFGWTVA